MNTARLSFYSSMNHLRDMFDQRLFNDSFDDFWEDAREDAPEQPSTPKKAKNAKKTPPKKKVRNKIN